jgi:cytochrome c oxidase cbb3-type subunit 3
LTEAVRRSSRFFSARRRKFLSAGLLLLLGLAAWQLRTGRQEAQLVRVDADTAASNPALLRVALTHGRTIFAQRCAACHGENGAGDHRFGYPDLTDPDWLYGQGAAGEIETVILYGIRAPHSGTWHLADMPAYASEHPYPPEPVIQPLTPGAIDDLVQFLRAVGGRSAERDAAQRGARNFREAGCYDCHAADASGDAAVGAPNLADNIWLYGDGTDRSVYDSIARGRAGVCPAWRNRLEALQIREVALYVYSLSHPSNGTQPKADHR